MSISPEGEASDNLLGLEIHGVSDGTQFRTLSQGVTNDRPSLFVEVADQSSTDRERGERMLHGCVIGATWVYPTSPCDDGQKEVLLVQADQRDWCGV